MKKIKKFIAVLSSYDVMAKITEVEIERETESSVWIKGRRSAKRSDWQSFFDSWDEAKEELIKCQEARVSSLKRQLEVAKSRLGNVRSMK